MSLTIKDLYVRLPKLPSKKEAAREALAAIERVYLRANGWKYIGDDYWRPPDDYPFKKRYLHRHGHAVNSQKVADSWSRF